MFCQVCGAHQSDEDDHCARCGHKLLVLSGGVLGGEETFDGDDEESFSFDEHLLERISILEEVLKRTGETVRNILGALHKQEENILINHAGLMALRDLLEGKAVIGRDEWNDLWQSKMDYQLLCVEKRERFSAVKDRIVGLYSGGKRKTFLQHLEEAEYALFGFRYEKALESFEAAFRLDRDDYELAYFLGELYFDQGQLDRALGFFQRALEAKPDHYEGLVYSGVIHHQHGRRQEAEDLLKRAVSLYPDHFLPLFGLGAVYAGDGQLTRAVLFLQKAVEIDPVPNALYLLGSCHYEMGKLAPAIEVLSQAVRLDPGFEECHHLLGLAYLDRRWTKKALESFRQAQRLNPRRLRYQDLVGFLSGDHSRPLPAVPDKAAEALSEAEKLLRENRGREALDAYARASAAEPENATILISWAIACLHLGRTQEARKLAVRVLDRDSSEMLRMTAYATLMESLRAEGQYREGNEIGERLLEHADSDYTKTIAYYELAYNFAEMEENLETALEYARSALERSPQELEQFPLAILGWVHYKRGELDEAVQYLERSRELDPSSSTLTHLGMALLASGDEERARTLLEEARRVTDRTGALEARMMEFMRDSARILQNVRSAD